MECNLSIGNYIRKNSHTARRTGITDIYLSHKCAITSMMHASGHKTQSMRFGCLM